MIKNKEGGCRFFPAAAFFSEIDIIILLTSAKWSVTISLLARAYTRDYSAHLFFSLFSFLYKGGMGENFSFLFFVSFL